MRQFGVLALVVLVFTAYHDRSANCLPLQQQSNAGVNATQVRNNSSTASGSVDKVRIVGGVETAEHEFPHIVSLSKQGSHFCGATIIHTEWIATAAHCISHGDFQIKAGEHNIENNEGTEQLVAPIKIVVHPHYNAATYENDIALVRVNPPFVFDGNVKAFNLPARTFVPSGRATAAGWGTTSEGSHLTSPVLRKVSVPIVENMECAKQYGANYVVTKMLCAGEPEGQKDSCQGDSGGPLMCTQSTTAPGASAPHTHSNLCGIVSFGYGCARKGYAGVYTKVSAYMDWIESNLYGADFVNANKGVTSTTPTPPKIAKPTTKKPKSRKNSAPRNAPITNYGLQIFTVLFMWAVSTMDY